MEEEGRRGEGVGGIEVERIKGKRERKEEKEEDKTVEGEENGRRG